MQTTSESEGTDPVLHRPASLQLPLEAPVHSIVHWAAADMAVILSANENAAAMRSARDGNER